jgi:3-dehydroquinate dehydratase/shikimate dehydrogenase
MSDRSRLCVTVTAASAAELRARCDAAFESGVADLVELRLDGLGGPAGVDALATVLAGRRGPVIVTCRPVWEGGAFVGDEPARRMLLEAALDAGADYVDVEWRAGFAADLIARTGGRRIVLSAHDFQGIPPALDEQAAQMAAAGAEVVKIAVTPSRLSDCLRLLRLHRRIGRAPAHVLIAMGDLGAASRILATRFGSAWTYAGDLSAVGQIDAKRLAGQFRFKSLTAATAVYGLTGSPIGHSVSPAMHNAAFAASGVDAVYLPLPAADAGDFLEFAAGIGLAGASITIPFKRALFERIDAVDAEARQVGAINTLIAGDGAWRGVNTDVMGFVEPLARRGVTLRGQRAAVLGAGGSARAVGTALVAAGADTRICARNREAAAITAAAVGARAGEWPPPAGSWDLLVNCTPVGMHPMSDVSPLDEQNAFRGAGTRIVYDLIYNPEHTRLLRDAAAAGCQTIGGLEMLVAQAEEQFRLWTGARPAAGVMTAAARARLAEFSRS